MSSVLTYSPAEIVQRLLVDLGHGIAPETDPYPAASWPVFSDSEPDMDRAITVYDTEGTVEGFTMPDTDIVDYHGVMIRVKATTHRVGYAKAVAIREALKSVNNDELTVDAGLGRTAYLVRGFVGLGQINRLGKETPTSRRSVFTLNGLVSLTQR